MNDALDEALERLAPFGTLYEIPGIPIHFSNHAAMVAEAMCVLGRDAQVGDWIERYVPRLEARPSASDPIRADEWREALGDQQRLGDWSELFGQALRDASWVDVLNVWVPRLAAGLNGGMHGAIRVADVVRSLGERDNELRRREVAEGLAEWASCHESLPDRRGPSARLLPSAAFRRLEQLPVEDRRDWFAIPQAVARLDGLPSFADAADLVDPDLDLAVFSSDVVHSWARAMVSNVADGYPRPLCHAMTLAGNGVLLAPVLGPEAAAAFVRYSWQNAAAFYCSMIPSEPAIDPDPVTEDLEALIDEAVACPDEHGVKVLELVLREVDEEADGDPDPMLLAAARDTTRRLNEVGLDLW